MQSSARIVQMPARGQVTLPRDFRRQLGLKEGSLLEMRLVDDRIEIRSVSTGSRTLREYTETEIQQFLEDDKISAETAETVRRLLASDQL